MRTLKINVLGHIYDVKIIKENEIPEDLKTKHETMSGLCENFSHELIVFQDEAKPANYRRLDLFEEKVAKHELLHAYFHKSGLSKLISEDTEEAIVDMLAINFNLIASNVSLIYEFFHDKEATK